METLKWYLDNARNAIKVFGRPYMLKDEDIVSHIANAMMVADQKYDGTTGSREGFRWARAEFAIRKIRSRKAKDKGYTIFSLNTERGEQGEYSDVLTKDKMPKTQRDTVIPDVIAMVEGAEYLTDREKFCVLNKYVEAKTLQEIGDELGTTRENARQAIENALTKLRKHM